MTTNCDIRSMLSVFFPFWRILSDGMPWILLTAVLSLLLDGAVLIFVLLVCRPRRGRIGDADVGNVWRRTVLPFFALDTLASLTGAGDPASLTVAHFAHPRQKHRIFYRDRRAVALHRPSDTDPRYPRHIHIGSDHISHRQPRNIQGHKGSKSCGAHTRADERAVLAAVPVGIQQITTKGQVKMSYDRRTLASDSPFAVGAAFLLTVAAVMMLAILPQRLRDGSMAALTLLPLLPSAACICTAVMLVSRKNSLVPTTLPVSAVCLYAAASSIGDSAFVCVVCFMISAALAALYLLSVAGTLSSRAPLLAVCSAAAVWSLITALRASGTGALLAGLAPALAAAAIFLVGCGMRRGRLY